MPPVPLLPPPEEDLSDDELMELDGFLGSPGLVESSLDVFGLEGFLAAILATSRRVEPSEWTPWIWDVDRGEVSPEFENAAQEERILGLVMRLYNDVAPKSTWHLGRHLNSGRATLKITWHLEPGFPLAPSARQSRLPVRRKEL